MCLNVCNKNDVILNYIIAYFKTPLLVWFKSHKVIYALIKKKTEQKSTYAKQ